MLDTLVDWKDREVSGTFQAPSIVHKLKGAKGLNVTIRIHEHTINVGRGWSLKVTCWNSCAPVLEKALRFRAEKFCDLAVIHKILPKGWANYRGMGGEDQDRERANSLEWG
jgi:hypothetical protein